MNLISHALVLAQSETQAANPVASLLPFLIIGLLFYFLLIRPQRKRAAEQQAMLRRTAVGDEVVTIGGFHGTIVELADDTMRVELAPGVVVTMARNAISRTLTEPQPFNLDDLDDDEFDEFDDDDEFGDDFDTDHEALDGDDSSDKS